MLNAIIIVAAVVLVLLPPGLDPAIRLKERQIRMGRDPESGGAS